MAVKEGGADPVANTKLRDLITKAKSLNVPNDNIKRIIDKASDDNSAAYEMVTYEGYGPGGVAVIVETATDNRNRTAPEVRHALSKFGGNMGTTGCVSFMFSEKGVIVVDNEDGDVDEDVLMDDALEAGAGDILTEEGAFEVYTEPSEFAAVCEALSAKVMADEMMISSRSVSGAIRKLVTDGFVEKVSTDPVLYALTDKGNEVTID